MLMYAVAMMARGWDGSGRANAPGFPEEWEARPEGFLQTAT
jgi:hypothetical protein